MGPYSLDYTINHNENEDEKDHIDRPRSRHGRKCSKHKKCLSIGPSDFISKNKIIIFGQFFLNKFLKHVFNIKFNLNNHT